MNHPSTLVFALYFVGGCLVLAVARLVYLGYNDEPLRIKPLSTAGGTTLRGEGDAPETAVSHHVLARANQQLETLQETVERTRGLLEQRTRLLNEKNAECDALRKELDESITLLFSVLSDDGDSPMPAITAERSTRIESELNGLRDELLMSAQLSREQSEQVESLRALLVEAELEIANLRAASSEQFTTLLNEQDALANAASQTVAQFGIESLPALTVLAREPQPAVRAWAARTIGQIGLDAAPAIPLLTEMLADPSEQVRLAARSALANVEP